MKYFRFTVLFLFIASVSVYAQTWYNVGAGVNGPVYAMAVYNGKLYVGGSFTSAGGIHANGIASWDGTTWDSVGSGVNGMVSTLCVFKGCMYVGGVFSSAGGQNDNNLAILCGTQWYWIDNKIWNPSDERSTPEWMMADDSLLYATCGPTVAEYDGTNWVGGFEFSVGFGGNGPITNGAHCQSVAFYKNGVAVSGDELINTTKTYSYYLQPDTDIVYYNGHSFSTLHALNGSYDLMSYNGDLYAVLQSNNFFEFISVYDGNQWTELGDDSMGYYINHSDLGAIHILSHYKGYIITGGQFDSVGQTAARNIAEWNGQLWQPLGEGVKDTTSAQYEGVYAMVEYHEKLYVGGSFSKAGGVYAANIASWVQDTTPAPVFDTSEIFPNPNNGTFYCTLKNGIGAGYIAIYDITGRAIGTLSLNKNETQISLQNCRPGVYVYRIVSQQGHTLARGKFIIQ